MPTGVPAELADLKMFTIHATSVLPGRLDWGFGRNMVATSYVVKPWSLEELIMGYVSLRMRPTFLSSRNFVGARLVQQVEISPSPT